MTTSKNKFPILAASLLPFLALACGGVEGENPPTDDMMTSSADTNPALFEGATSAVTAPSAVTLSWKAARDEVSPSAKIVYLVYQSTTAGGENFAMPSYTTQAGATNYAVTGLEGSTKYYFVVRSRDEAGNIDTNTKEVSATTPADKDTQAPKFAGLETATANGTRVTLRWTAATDNMSTAAQIVYLIYQSDIAGGEKFATPSYTTQPGAVSYDVSGLAAGSTYYFVVRAKDAAGNIDTNSVEKNVKTASPTLSGNVQPIFDANCTGGCHGAGAAGGLDLSSAATSYANLVAVPSKQSPTTQRVLANQPDKSYLMFKLLGMGPGYTGVRMPKGKPALSTADIDAVKSWIAGGALNN